MMFFGKQQSACVKHLVCLFIPGLATGVSLVITRHRAERGEKRQAERETCRTGKLKARLFCPQADGGQDSVTDDSVHRQIL